MRFKVIPEVQNQLLDMPVRFFTDEDVENTFFYDRKVPRCVAAFHSDRSREAVQVILDHPDIIFAEGTTIIYSNQPRARLSANFGEKCGFRASLDTLLEKYYPKSLVVIRAIWFDEGFLAANFTAVPDHYREKVRAAFIDSFIHTL